MKAVLAGLVSLPLVSGGCCYSSVFENGVEKLENFQDAVDAESCGDNFSPLKCKQVQKDLKKKGKRGPITSGDPEPEVSPEPPTDSSTAEGTSDEMTFRFADLSGCGAIRVCNQCVENAKCMWSESGCTKNIQIPGAPKQWCSPVPTTDTVKDPCEALMSCTKCTRTAGCIWYRGMCTYSRGTGCLDDPANCVNYEQNCPAPRIPAYNGGFAMSWDPAGPQYRIPPRTPSDRVPPQRVPMPPLRGPETGLFTPSQPQILVSGQARIPPPPFDSTLSVQFDQYQPFPPQFPPTGQYQPFPFNEPTFVQQDQFIPSPNYPNQYDEFDRFDQTSFPLISRPQNDEEGQDPYASQYMQSSANYGFLPNQPPPNFRAPPLVQQPFGAPAMNARSSPEAYTQTVTVAVPVPVARQQQTQPVPIAVPGSASVPRQATQTVAVPVPVPVPVPRAPIAPQQSTQVVPVPVARQTQTVPVPVPVPARPSVPPRQSNTQIVTVPVETPR